MSATFRPARALIVGINAYDSRNITDLQGCVPDARAMAALLQAHYGMDPAHIRLLTSPAEPPAERATRAAIISGFRDFLLKELKAGEEGFFYYSGHGSTTRLASEISFGEAEGQTLVPADARVNGVLDLLDREMRCLIGELIDKGIRLTVVADSCHAAGAMRDPGLKEKPPATGTVARLTGDGGTVTRTLQTVLEGNISLEHLSKQYAKEFSGYTLLAGSLGTQKSYEISRAGQDGKTEWCGAMTTALLEALARSGGPMNYQELARAVRGRLPDHPQKKDQYPELSGDQERQLFSKESLVRERALFAVQQVQEGAIVFDGGSFDGIDVGSILTAYSDWSLKEARGQWQVETCWLRSARARPVEPSSPLPELGQPLQLTEMAARATIHFAPGTEQVRLEWYKSYLPADTQRTYKNALKEAPKTTIEFYLQGEINGSPFLKETKARGDYNVEREGDTLLVRRADGQEVEGLRYPTKKAIEMGPQINRVICYDLHQRQPSAVQRLALPIATGDGMGLRLRVKSLPYIGAPVPLTFEEGAKPLTKNDRIEITLDNRGTQALFLALYRLYPQKYALERLWPRDGTGQLVVGDTASFVWQANEAGPLYLQLIASTQPLVTQVWPCGQASTQRHFGIPQGAMGKREGWNVAWFTLGRGPA